MRRTTISHSDGGRAALVAGLLLAAVPLAAQMPPSISRPIRQAQHAAVQAGQPARDAQQSAAAEQQPQRPGQQPASPVQGSTQQPAGGASRPIGQPPETHTVARGETLWSLASQFLGDPLLWPEIYRLNTTVIEDPHWIFPGEELRFVAPPEQQVAAGPAPVSGNVAVTPMTDSARAAAPQQRPSQMPDAPTVFSPRARTEQTFVSTEGAQAYRAVRAGEYYSSGFIADSRTLESGVIGQNVQRAALRRVESPATAGIYASVTISPPAGQAYQHGDLLLAYETMRAVPPYGDIIKPLGLLSVTSDGQAGQQVTATVSALYGQLGDGTKVLRIPHYRSDNSAHSVPVDSGITGQVIATRRQAEIIGTQDVLFIDRGSDDGVHLGDVFRIASPARGMAPARDQADVLVVNTRAKTATAVVVQVSQPDIQAGATARQVRRMPS